MKFDKINQEGFLGFIIVFFFFITLISGGIFIVVKLPSSLPGDLIYPLKGIYENLKLATNELNDENRAQVFIDRSNNRLDEFEALVDKREYKRITETLDQMVLMQKKALDNIERVQSRTTNVVGKVSYFESSLQKQLSILKKQYYEVPPEIYNIIDKAIGATQESLDRVYIIRGRR